jgi:phage baseplate assembly protein W
MSGMDAKTGKYMRDEIEHVKQSIHDIITTPLGTCIMDKDYGSRIFDLIDSPSNELIDFYQAVISAIEKWEPRFKVKQVNVLAASIDDLSSIKIEIEGVYVPQQKELTVTVGL